MLQTRHPVLVAPDGRAFEFLTPAERAALEQSHPQLYNLLHANWIARGEPEADAS